MDFIFLFMIVLINNYLKYRNKNKYNYSDVVLLNGALILSSTVSLPVNQRFCSRP